jgi:hypothetical protein
MTDKHKKAVGETPAAFRFYPHHFKGGVAASL